MKTTAMLRRHIWLTLGLLPFLSAGVLGATDEREHVHIKVRMPEMVRKHTHYQHRTHKHPHQHHHHPPMHPHDYTPSAMAPYTRKKVKPALPPLHNHIDLDWSAAAGAPQLQQLAPILPALVPDESDLAPNYGPALFDNDIIDNYVHSNNNPNANQQQQPLLAPTVAALQAMMSVPMTQQQQQQQQQQLMQHMELMGALAAATAAGGGSGGGVEGAATNTLLVDDFLAELQRLYANSKYTIAPQQLMPHRILRHTATPVAPRTVSATKQRHKRKKYRDTYQQQQHQQQLQQQYYANYYQQQQQPQLFNANNIYANAVASGDLNDDDNGDEEDLDDATTAAAATHNTANDYSAADESMEELNGHAAVNPVSYQQLVDAYQQQQLQPTATTRLEWRPQQQQQQKHFKHLQQQDETQFVLPTVHYRQQHIKTAQPINVADSGAGGVSITAAGSDFEETAMQQQQQQRQRHQQHQSSTRYKKRKNRIKRKRNRIVVQ